MSEEGQISHTMAALNDPAPRARRAAVLALGQAGDAHAVDMLYGVLADSDGHVRFAAAEALAAIGIAGFEPLLRALRHDDKRVRTAAARALGRLREGDAYEGLIQALDDRSARVRREAARGLGLRDGPHIVRPLCRALTDRDAHVRSAAIKGLVRMGKISAEPLFAALEDQTTQTGEVLATREALVEALVRLEVSSIELLCRALADPNIRLRRWAVASMGMLQDARAIEPLCRAFEDPDRAVSWSAGRALNAMGDRTVLPEKILAQPGMTGQQRHKALTAIARTWFRSRWPFSDNPLRDVRRFCRKMLARENMAAGAREVLRFLDEQLLVRPTERAPGTERATLLRPADGVPAPASDSLVRPAEEAGEQQEIAPRRKRRFWRRE